MKKINPISKTLSLILSASLLFSACSFKNEVIKQEEFITVGMECNYPPYNYTLMNNNGEAVKIEATPGYADGYDIMIAKKIAKDLGKKVKVKKIAWDGLIPALDSGAIDMIVAGMSDTLEREKQVDFSTPYFSTEFVALVKKDSPFKEAKTLSDFKGARLVGQKDTSYDLAIDFLEGAIHESPLSSIPLIIYTIKSGINDATIVEKAVGDSIISTTADITQVRFPKGTFKETDDMKTSVSVAVKKGNENLLTSINKTLKNISDEERNDIMKKAILKRNIK